MTNKLARLGVLVVIVLPVVATGATALVGLLDSGSEIPCGKCSGTSPDPSSEAWIIAFWYVGLIGALCLVRFVAATDGAPTNMPRYRGSLGFLVAASLALAFRTPASWEPLRPALIVGGLSSLPVLFAGGRLARISAGLDATDARLGAAEALDET